MGSSGTGNFSDYPGSSRGSGTGSTKFGGGGGGQAPPDPCAVNLGTVQLEDVATCPYFTQTGALPLIGESASVAPTLLSGRLAVQSDLNGLVIGLLPTKFNYLRPCLEKGFTYDGQVSAASATPVPTVSVLFN